MRGCAAFTLVLLCILSGVPDVVSRSFTIQGNDFMKDGEPFRIISGDIHYWRSVPEDWEALFAMCKAQGLNTVTLYFNWALHEPQPGQFNFSGPLDIVKYIKLAQAADLLVIARVGPYITAETDFGGLPYWLVNIPGIGMRTTEQQWLTAVGNYFDQLIPLLAPLQYSNGGPIINFQIEDDTDLPINLSLTHGYYSWLLQALRARGITALVNTLAAPYPWQIMRASTPGAWLALEFNYDFDSRIAFDVFRVFYPTGPIMVMETYPVNSEDLEGVLPHQTLDPQLFANAVAEMLARNASVSIYPIQGGTNFGFTNGANHPGGPIDSAGYTAISTSYDYDAPISECGDPSEKFFALRDVFSNYVDLPAGPPPLPTPKGAYGTINLTQYSCFWDTLPFFKSVNAVEPIGMEALNQAYGYVLYTTTIEALTTNGTLNVSFIQDKAQVYLDQVYQGTIGWDLKGAPTSLTLNPTNTSASTSVLSILVENKGRPCAQLGPVDGLSWAKKGIYGNVTLNSQILLNWTMHSVPLDETPSQMPLNWQTYSQPLGQQPIFYRGTFNVPDATPLRTYFLTNGWGHGVAFINGFNLGRFTEQGPQMALYVPAATLRSGMNELVLFETDSPAQLQPPPFRSFSSVPMPYWL